MFFNQQKQFGIQWIQDDTSQYIQFEYFIVTSNQIFSNELVTVCGLDPLATFSRSASFVRIYEPIRPQHSECKMSFTRNLPPRLIPRRSSLPSKPRLQHLLKPSLKRSSNGTPWGYLKTSL